jgi:voltage-gated potassium channel Kch
MRSSPSRAVATHGAALLLAIIAATAFFALYEHAPWLVAFNFVVMLVTLVGSPYSPTTLLGTLVAGALAFVSIGIVVSFISRVVVAWAIDLWRSGRLEVRRHERHVIVVGTADTAWEILDRAKETSILVTGDRGSYEEALRRGFSAVHGDPSSSRVLEEAGIATAVAFVAASHDDALNAFACLSARRLRPDLRIAARISREESRDKLEQVGADDIICPATLAAERIMADVVRWRTPGAG